MTQALMNERHPGVIKRMYQDGKVGGTAGWTVRAAADTWMSTCAASATAGTLVIPLTGLEVGDIIVGHHLLGQCESAGNAAKINAEIYKFAPIAAASAASLIARSGPTHAAARFSVIADTALVEANTGYNIPQADWIKIAEGLSYFALITATTAGSTDFELLAFMLHLRKAA